MAMTALAAFIKAVKLKDLFPKNVQISEWRDWTLVSCFDKATSSVISESVSMGIDKNPETALFKGLTEYLERRLAKASQDPIVRLTERTDGFAAFPVLNGQQERAQAQARRNALDEAVERLMWATWWDDDSVTFSTNSISSSPIAQDLQALTDQFDLARVFEVQVDDAQNKYRLSILVAESKGGGFVTGGAASEINAKEKRFVPAFGELLRHLLALEQIRTLSDSELSFYEKRLSGFGSGRWGLAVRQRLSTVGNYRVELPSLVVDREVQQEAPDLVKIHRCLFTNQPIFIGGPLERLCI